MDRADGWEWKKIEYIFGKYMLIGYILSSSHIQISLQILHSIHPLPSHPPPSHHLHHILQPFTPDPLPTILLCLAPLLL